VRPEDRLALARVRAQQKLGVGLRGERLHDYIMRVSPHHPPPRHLKLIISHLERAQSATQTVRVAFSMPPRHAKTTLIQHAIPWWLSKFPQETCAYASYSDRQAWSKSRVMRTIAGYSGVAIAGDQANVAEWRTPLGGGLLAVGAGSGLTGQGVSGLMVVDDPFKNPEDAQSQIIRDKVGDWFDGVVMTRLEGAAVFVLHTRWHEDDLIGRLAKRAGWVVINLPAIAEDDDILGRAPGELLWPERQELTKAIYEAKSNNAFLFAALYQGRPRPRGGAVFGQPHYYDPDTTDFEGCRFVLAADPAASTKTSADFSAVVVLSVRGHGIERKAYVRKVYREQVAIPQFAQDLLAMQGDYGEAEINIEAVGGFKAIPQMLQAIRPNLRINEIVPMGDKLMRAQPAASAWNEARILVPGKAGATAAPWLGPFLDEIAKFTGVNDEHDDQIDALAHAWNSDVVPRPSWSDVL
jgi:predicted phage terminase large subunit-like protein